MSLTETEIWLPMPHYKGVYEVSNMGRIRSLPKIVWNGKFYSNRKERILKLNAIDTSGYVSVHLTKSGVGVTKNSHIYVAKAFIPNPENKPQVNHKNGDKTDNRVSNLEWATRSENIKHSFSTGLQSKLTGTLNPNSKFSNKEITDIRLKYKPRIYSFGMLAKEYGVDKSTIIDIVNKKTWTHL